MKPRSGSVDDVLLELDFVLSQRDDPEARLVRQLADQSCSDLRGLLLTLLRAALPEWKHER